MRRWRGNGPQGIQARIATELDGTPQESTRPTAAVLQDIAAGAKSFSVAIDSQLYEIPLEPAPG
jgi:hypothetical protein